MNIGYCCINLSLKDRGITTNRTMKLATFKSKGLNYVSEIAIKNLEDLVQIMDWNSSRHIHLFRMSSSIFSFMSEYDIEQLPNFNIISRLCKTIGGIASRNNIRLTFHPDHFCVLGSDKSEVVSNTIKELEQHSKIMDLMGLSATSYNVINIHLSNTKPDKISAADRFCRNFELLSDNLKNRLTIEIDDKEAQYTTQDLYDLVHRRIGIPIVFDTLHYQCNPGELCMEDSLELCLSTWGNITPLIHHSSSKKLYEDANDLIRTHADYLYESAPKSNIDFDVELESKAKDLSLLKYMKEFI